MSPDSVDTWVDFDSNPVLCLLCCKSPSIFTSDFPSPLLYRSSSLDVLYCHCVIVSCRSLFLIPSSSSSAWERLCVVIVVVSG